jgi:hypothetical protein
MKKPIVLIAIGLLSSVGLKAQNLVVTLDNATTETFAVASIQSIKFGFNTMILKELNGTVTTWNIDDITNYAFSLLSSDDDDLIVTSENALSVYPNPSGGDLSIRFHSIENTTISVEIVGVDGRRLHEVYSGDHQGLHTYRFTARLSTGLYYCRVMTDRKMIIKPFVVN